MDQVITSTKNPKVKAASQVVSSAAFRRESGLFALEGLRLCRDALQSGARFEQLYYTADFAAAEGELLSALRASCAECFETGAAVMSRLCDTASPQGVFALCRKPDLALPGCGRILVLDRVSDPSNLGAAARTAEALGIGGMLLSPGCCDPFSPKALRASMGALVRLPVKACADLSAELRAMAAGGFAVYGAVVDGGSDVRMVRFAENCALVIGNEANGICDEVRASCTAFVSIAMPGRAESLNASVAAALLMWETVRGV